MKKNKAALFFSFLVFFTVIAGFFILFKVVSQAQNSRSSDAIAVKVIPNPDYLSAREWYDRQGFTGSPQSLTVDGYRAIREGRTVYVNAANIDNQGTDSVSDDLYYANIYLISYNQQAESATQDIFSRILKNWKFNSNLSASGVCADHPEVGCRGEADCPVGDYCLSRKAGVTRDTIRLADLRDIQAALEDYNRDNGHYPLLRSGSYLPHKTISVWPSWQKLLAQYLDGQLPEDPINRLGECGEGYNPRTCWNEATQSLSLSVDLDDYDFPAYSRIYSYRTNETGTEADYCVLLESDYENISHFNCEAATDNNPPILDGSNLTGDTKEEFTGYISAHDPDGDELAWEVNLYTPDSLADWSGLHQWQWDQGHSGFSIREAGLPTQRILHAAQAGNASQPGDYQLEVVLSDGNGGVTREILDVDIRPVPMQINEVAGEVVIGNSGQFTFQGTDMSMNDLTLITYQDASFDNGASVSGLSESQLNSHGFSLNGMNVDVDYAPAQQTGQYSIDILAPDPVFAPDGIESTAAIRIVNNPPRIEAFRANYVDGSHGPCERGDGPCEMHIDNMEPATVSVMAEDEDGHNLTYSFLSAPQELSIDSNTGEITGLELLNQYEIERASHNIEVEVRDEYCGQSSGGEDECQDQWQFTLWVMPYCGAVVPESYSTVTLFDGDIGGNPNDDPLIVSQPNTVRSRELNLNDISGGCSEVGQGTVEMRIEGESSDKLVVFVVDLSLSMDNTPPDQGYPLEDEDYYAVNLMAEKLAGPIGSYPDPSDESNTDVFSTIWRKANAVEDANTSVKIAMVGFHSYAWLWDASGRTHSYRYINSVNDVSDDYFFDITNEADLTTLRTIAYNRFNPLPETNILDGLNLADWLLQYSEREDPDSGRNVILLSDGKPEISRSVRADTCWSYMCNCYNYDGPSYLCPCLQYCGGGGGWEPITLLDDWGKQLKTESEADFKIAITEPVLEGGYDCNHDRDDDEEEDCPYGCWDGVAAGEEPDPSVPQNECCVYRDLLPDRLYRSVCTISNIDEEAGDIKEMSELYSIYYDTGHTEAETNAQNMCLWSSEENSLCNPYDPLENDYTFAFASSDIDSLFDSVVSGIFSKPGDIFVNDQSISDPEPEELVSEQILCLNDPDDTGGVGCMANLTDVDCSLESFYSQYMEGYGEVSYTDLFLNYCPAKLHQ